MSNGFSSIEDLIPKTPGSAAGAGAQQPVDDDEESEAPVETRSEKAQENVGEKMEQIRLQTLEDETRAKAELFGIPYFDLEAFPIGPEVISLIPEKDATDNKAVAFFRLEDQIRIATVDPDNPKINEIIAQLQKEHEGSKVKLYLISQHSFDQAIKLYKTVAKIRKIESGVHITKKQLDAYAKELTSFDIFDKRIDEVNMTEAFAMIIAMAMTAGSSDIHIEAEEESAVLRFRVDGVLTVVAHMEPEKLPKLVSRIKGIAGLKLNITAVPQDGRISIELGEDDKLDIRVSTLPSAYGESIVFRLLKSSSVGLSFEDLGMRPLAFERLKIEIEKPNGMIITTGPTGSGKTTTLYAILNKLNKPENKIITLENPVEYKLKGIVQSQIDHSKKYTFALGLRAILRQDPDIVMVGEIRDLETADTAIQAALTGHLMLSTIHTNDATGAIPRFLGMGVNPALLAPALNAVIGQRLVRRICADCKKEYTPSAEQIQRAKEWVAAIPEASGEERPDVDKVMWYKGEGCQTCKDTGFKGRVGIYEIFTMIPEIEKQVLSGKASEYDMKTLLHDAGMVTMGQDGVLKAIEGITLLDEVFRVAKA
ncbi:MAG: GspE/PulE family protein [Candidatus Kerfeldbacteria bacterium]